MKTFKSISILLSVIIFAGSLFGGNAKNTIPAKQEREISDSTRQLLETYTDDRKYSEVCWLTTHNAFANDSKGWSYSQQNLDIDEQYELGVRSFMVDLYLFQPGNTVNEAGETITPEPVVAMCHEPGFLGGSNCLTTRLMLKNGEPEPFLNVLLQIKEWLEQDLETIITLQVESRFGVDGAEEALSNLLKEAELIEYLYIPQVEPEEIRDWPMLGQMRESNRRLVLFSDNPNDGFIHTSAYRETRFDLSRFSQCEMREDNRDINKIMPLFVLNHFHSISMRLNGFWRNYESVNSYQKIMERVGLCEAEHNMLPNFLVLDFIEEGSFGGALQAVSDINLQPKDRFTHDLTHKPVSEEDLLIYDIEAMNAAAEDMVL